MIDSMNARSLNKKISKNPSAIWKIVAMKKKVGLGTSTGGFMPDDHNIDDNDQINALRWDTRDSSVYLKL